MGLRLKFNLLLFFTFIIGVTASGFIANYILQKNARHEVLNNAGILMASNLAIRMYTVEHVKPLLARQQKKAFVKETIPAYAVSQNMEWLRKLGDKHENYKKYRSYTYREATINPTNIANRASDWERDIIHWFRENANKEEYIGVHQTQMGKSLYLSRPIRITDQACLACHSTPEAAPVTLVKEYGRNNGFGWKLNQVVGAQIVTIPMKVPLQRAQTAFMTFMILLIGVFMLVAILLNLFLNTIVIKRIKRMSRVANDISLGSNSTADFNLKGNDEVASLAKSFNRMRRSLSNAMDMLEETTGNFTKM